MPQESLCHSVVQKQSRRNKSWIQTILRSTHSGGEKGASCHNLTFTHAYYVLQAYAKPVCTCPRTIPVDCRWLRLISRVPKPRINDTANLQLDTLNSPSNLRTVGGGRGRWKGQDERDAFDFLLTLNFRWHLTVFDQSLIILILLNIPEFAGIGIIRYLIRSNTA